MNKELKDMSTTDLVIESTRLEQEIKLKTMRHNILIQELIRRYPKLIRDDTFPILGDECEKVDIGRIR